ncbi:hypothetical protein BDZ85DRAFT_261702 [Elsinoe ampelina]|uniref:Uncharacterized protein n=1 Tax=Elsinoe ampelina TaxID=302913 RepID=A0A6A6GDM5_9PEZI|nr:hypothetical protein BDZ85DRAFT_261702 [Elsinoe ampelina]
MTAFFSRVTVRSGARANQSLFAGVLQAVDLASLLSPLAYPARFTVRDRLIFNTFAWPSIFCMACRARMHDKHER